MSAAVAFAFGAGLLGTANPCGLALLPGLLSIYVAEGSSAGQRSLHARLSQGFSVGLVLSAGFAAVFVFAGLAVAAGVRSFLSVVPWLAAAIGVALFVLGLAMVLGRQLHLFAAGRVDLTRRAGGSARYRRIALFGATYALASLSCTLAIFLVVVAQAVSVAGPFQMLAVFGAYAAGSATILVALCLSAAVAQDALARGLRRLAPFFGRVAGGLLALSGAYLVVYWMPTIAQVERGGSSGLVDAIQDVSSTVQSFLADHTGDLAVAGAALVVLGLGVAVLNRRTLGGEGSTSEGKSTEVTRERPDLERPRVTAPSGGQRKPSRRTTAIQTRPGSNDRFDGHFKTAFRPTPGGVAMTTSVDVARRAAVTTCLAIVLAAVGAGSAHAATPPSAADERVRASASAELTPWISVTLDAIAETRTNPPRASRALALVSVAIWRAVRAERGSARGTVVTVAAGTVFRGLFGRDPSGARRPSAAARGPRARGRAIGLQVLKRARADRSDAVFRGQPPSGAGRWVPTPPAFAPALEPMAGRWQPWNLRSGSQFRPEAPPEYGSRDFHREVQATYDATNPLSPAQARIAEFWNDGPGTVTPAGHWNQIALGLLASQPRSPTTVARLFATLNTVTADAFIACWDAKFKYSLMRPVTAIQQLDRSWSPHILTPPFPSYPSGHSTVSSASAAVLSAFFPRQRAELRRLAREAGLSRIYGGIHFPIDNSAGAEVGRRVAREGLRRWLRR